MCQALCSAADMAGAAEAQLIPAAGLFIYGQALTRKAGLKASFQAQADLLTEAVIAAIARQVLPFRCAVALVSLVFKDTALQLMPLCFPVINYRLQEASKDG